MKRPRNPLYCVILSVLACLVLTGETQARVYHAGLGRFLTRDPVSYRDGPNLYQYAKSKPIVMRDPCGLVAWPNDSYPTDLDGNPTPPPTNPALHPRVCCGPLMGWEPLTHCEIRWGPCAVGERTSPLWRDTSPTRTLKDGTPCCQATKEQIASCLGMNPGNNKPYPWAYGPGNNCQEGVKIKLEDCCLLTSWEPSIHAWIDAPCAEWGWCTQYVPNGYQTPPTPIKVRCCVRYATGLTPPASPDGSLPEDPWPRPPRPTPLARPPGWELP